MLSDFLRFRLTDTHGHAGRLRDVVVDVSTPDYPPVSRLFIHVGRPRRTITLPWSSVEFVEWRTRCLQVTDLEAGEPAPSTPDELPRMVRAKRDIIDALIVDVGRRHTLRANDLWFREQDGQLRLAGADASPWAVLRRLGRGILGRGAERRLVDWKDIEFLRGDPTAAAAGDDYHRQITRLQPGEIARLLDALPYLHAAELLTLIDDPIAADVLETMSPGRQRQVIQVLEQDEAGRLLGLMAPDAGADLLGYLEPERASVLLAHVPQTERNQLIDLLRYPHDTAGGIMTNQLVCVRAEERVGDARRALKDSIRSPDFAHYLYVIDSDEGHHLEGVVTLREFAVADDDLPIGELMNADVRTIDALESARDAAQHVADQQLAALPVVSRDGRLLGAVTIDMALAQIIPAAWRDQTPRVFS